MTLQESVAAYLAERDSAFVEEGLPLRHRPLQGALAFVKDCVNEVQGGTLEAPIGQAWFDAIHYEALRWYAERYGDAMRCDSDGDARGLVVVGGAPIALLFQLTVSRPGSQPHTTRLSFPDSVRDDEDVTGFIDGRFTIGAFPEAEQRLIRERISDVASRTRRINRGLRFANLDETGRAFVSRAMWALRHGVESITANSPERLGLAVWELNLVGELSIKTFLTQREVAFPKTHVVRDLYERGCAAGLPGLEDTVVVDVFPKKEQAIQHRYGEVPPPSLRTAVALYDAALAMALHCASHLSRGIWIAPDGWIEVRTIGSLARGA